MAAFSAKLEVDGQTYPVVYCDYRFHQATGARGQVREKVRHGLLEVVLDVPRGDQLMVWAATPHYPLSGHVSFFQVNTFMAHETVSFQDGQCIGYREEFEAGADGMGSYRCTLTIAAAKLTLTAGGPPTSAAAFAQAASPRAPGGGLAATARRAQDVARQVRGTAAKVQQTAAAVQQGVTRVRQVAKEGGSELKDQAANATMPTLVPPAPGLPTLPFLPPGTGVESLPPTHLPGLDERLAKF